MAKRGGLLSIDFSEFEDLAEKLDLAGKDLKKVFTDVFEQVGDTVQSDTADALITGNLPAGGRYSRGDTRNNLDMNPKPVWSGSVIEMGLGFDKTKRGAGGWLITGTPRMRPVSQLEDIYNRKRYVKDLKKQIRENLQDWLDGFME